MNELIDKLIRLKQIKEQEKNKGHEIDFYLFNGRGTFDPWMALIFFDDPQVSDDEFYSFGQINKIYNSSEKHNQINLFSKIIEALENQENKRFEPTIFTKQLKKFIEKYPELFNDKDELSPVSFGDNYFMEILNSENQKNLINKAIKNKTKTKINKL